MKIQYLFITILLITSCSKADLPTKESKNIIGEWEWIESRGGLSGDAVLTPETQSETRQLIFKDNGKYRDCIDDKVEDRGKYTIVEKSDSWGTYYLLNLDGKDYSGNSELRFRTADTIVLFPTNCADCFVASYVRTE